VDEFKIAVLRGNHHTETPRQSTEAFRDNDTHRKINRTVLFTVLRYLTPVTNRQCRQQSNDDKCCSDRIHTLYLFFVRVSRCRTSFRYEQHVLPSTPVQEECYDAVTLRLRATSVTKDSLSSLRILLTSVSPSCARDGCCSQYLNVLNVNKTPQTKCMAKLRVSPTGILLF